jgi:hypothetical protein
MKRWLPFLFATPLLAHMVSMSTGELKVEGNNATYELKLPTYEAAHAPNPERTLLQHVILRSGGVQGKMTESHCSDQAGTYTCDATYEFPEPVEVLDVQCTLASVTVPNHVHVLRAYKGDKMDEAVFDVSFTTAEIRFRPPAPWEIFVRESGAGFLRAVGGPAPLLFLVSLVLAARSRKELLILTLAFFTGEVLSCVFAWRIPIPITPRFIEAAAALTIAYLAFEVVLLPNSGQRWLVVGLLGLFHGQYFSLFLASSGYKVPSFLSGVIAGELLVLAILALGLRRLLALVRLPNAVPVAATLLLTVGVVWFVVRVWV